MSQRQIRLLMVSASFFPEVGGLEAHVYEVSRRMSRFGIDATVLTTDRQGTLPTCDTVAGVPVLRVRAWPRERDYYAAPGLFTPILRGGWDLVHCQGVHTLVPPVALLAAQSAGIPTMLSFHSSLHGYSLGNAVRPVQWAILRPLLLRARRLVAVSAYEATFFQQTLHLPAERFVTISNGSDLPPPAADVMPDPEHPLIVSVGRLHPIKGHQRIIEALPLVLQHIPNVRLRIVGNGPYEAELRQLAARLGVADHVTIQGIPANDRSAMANLLARAALVTLLSEWEGNPVAALEALAVGRPMLVTYTSGLQEFVDQGLARGLPLDTTAPAVAQAVVQQLREPLLPSGIGLRTWDDCATDLAMLYQEMLAGPTIQSRLDMSTR
jgi:glycosyltransferase involved in cell wall biosynthesis